MKTLLFIIFSLCFSSFNRQLNLDSEANFSCTIHSKFKTYKIGQTPDIQVEILNKSKDDIYLIGALDGSDIKRRMPYCYFTIEKPEPDTIPYLRCGFANPLRIAEYRLVKAGEIFNPYAQIDDKGFWPDYKSQEKKHLETQEFTKYNFIIRPILRTYTSF